MFRRRPRFQRFTRGRRTLVWAAFSTNTNGTGLTNVTLADYASVGITSGNITRGATLLRVRADFYVFSAVLAVTPQEFDYGFALYDVAEASTTPGSTAYGQDEDVLLWGSGVVTGSSNPAGPCIWSRIIDIKAKRKFNVENELRLNFQPVVATTLNLCITGRALFQVA